MHYPVWYVPFLTAPMLIALVSVLHVIVSHYAVGGGLFLAIELRHADRIQRPDYRAYLKDHAWFFILVTVVYGAITGAGIWWTIGLASPLATESLVRIFVFGWAIEWVFFLVEIVAAFVFFYAWDRLDRKTHQQVGFLYAGSAWMSLVIITGITGFMLNSGRWPETHDFWAGFFNPQFLPQTISRTGGALLLASLYVYLHAAFRIRDEELRRLVAHRSTRPALLGAIMITVGGLGWYLALPESAREALPAASMLNVMMTLLFVLTPAVFLMLWLGPYRNPGWMSPGFAILLFSFGLTAMAAGEQVREAVRKPYILYNIVLGNQVMADEVPALRRTGCLEGGGWTKAAIRQQSPGAVTAAGAVDPAALLSGPAGGRLAAGRTLYHYHCGSCHADRVGFSALSHLMRGWTPDMIHGLVSDPHRARFFMPPWCGTAEEARLLSEYLVTIVPGLPAGMNFGGADPGAPAGDATGEGVRP